MLKGSRLLDRTVVQLLAAALTAGFMVQTEWAMEHSFEYFDARVFASALALFMLLLAVRAACRQLFPAAGEGFDERYSEAVWLLAVVPAFLVVENQFLRVVGMVVYVVIVARYAATVLDVAWLRRLMAKLADAVPGSLRAAAQPPVAYRVRDDWEDGVLDVAVLTRRGITPSTAALRQAVSMLYRDLPDVDRFSEIRVNVDGIGRVDATLPLLLAPLSHYAALGDIAEVTVVTAADRLEEVAEAVPAERYSVQAG